MSDAVARCGRCGELLDAEHRKDIEAALTAAREQGAREERERLWEELQEQAHTLLRVGDALGADRERARWSNHVHPDYARGLRDAVELIASSDELTEDSMEVVRHLVVGASEVLEGLEKPSPGEQS